MHPLHQSARRIRPYRQSFPRSGGALAAVAPIVLCLAFFWPFGGGGRKVHMMAGTATPGAQATIVIKQGKNNNEELDIKAQALAPPSSLNPAENVYVVWIQPPGQAPQNHGRLEVNQNEQAELHTETPYRRFKVFITAEQNPQAQMPMGPKVLSADVSQN